MSGRKEKLPKLKAPPSLDDIRRIRAAIAPYIHKTPVITSDSINRILGCEIFFKAENFQRIGAFKMRGALSAALTLTEEELSKGITTHSSGNHGQAVAKTAYLLGVPAYIVMPRNSTPIKIVATKGYGAEVRFCEPNIEAREAGVAEVIRETGAVNIHPYNDYHVIAGQATAALEFLEETPDLDYLLVPVSGGGLLAGSAIVAKEFSNALIIGAEPSGADDAARSLKSGVLEKNIEPITICDGLRGNLGSKNFEIIKENVDDILTVSDDMIIEAMSLIWNRMKVIVEPSAVVPLAVIMNDRKRFQGKRVGLILSGGNLDLKNLPF